MDDSFGDTEFRSILFNKQIVIQCNFHEKLLWRLPSLLFVLYTYSTKHITGNPVLDRCTYFFIFRFHCIITTHIHTHTSHHSKSIVHPYHEIEEAKYNTIAFDRCIGVFSIHCSMSMDLVWGFFKSMQQYWTYDTNVTKTIGLVARHWKHNEKRRCIKNESCYSRGLGKQNGVFFCLFISIQ